MTRILRKCTTLELSRCDGVLIVQLNRPQALNAINRAMRDELRWIFDDAQHDRDTLAVVLTAGGRAFSAGHDIKELLALSPSEANAVMLEIGTLYRDLRAFSKPLIAALNGLTLGGGVALALLADARLATSKLELGLPEIDRGLITALGPWLLGLYLPAAVTQELVLSGKSLSAEQCLGYSLVSKIVDESELLARGRSMGLSLAQKPQEAFAMTKARFVAVTEAGFREALQAGARMQELAQLARAKGRQQERSVVR